MQKSEEPIQENTEEPTKKAKKVKVEKPKTLYWRFSKGEIQEDFHTLVDIRNKFGLDEKDVRYIQKIGAGEVKSKIVLEHYKGMNITRLIPDARGSHSKRTKMNK